MPNYKICAGKLSLSSLSGVFRWVQRQLNERAMLLVTVSGNNRGGGNQVYSLRTSSTAVAGSGGKYALHVLWAQDVTLVAQCASLTSVVFVASFGSTEDRTFAPSDTFLPLLMSGRHHLDWTCRFVKFQDTLTCCGSRNIIPQGAFGQFWA